MIYDLIRYTIQKNKKSIHDLTTMVLLTMLPMPCASFNTEIIV